MADKDTDQAAANEFGAWLVQNMASKKLTGAELARLVQQRLPEGVHFTASNISHYRAGRSVPRALVREVIEQIMKGERGVAPPTARDPPITSSERFTHAERIQLEDLGSGRARIVIDQQMPWAEALELIKLLKLDASQR